MEERAQDPTGDGHAADGVAVTRTRLPAHEVDVGGCRPHGAARPAPVAQEVVATLVGVGPPLTGSGPGHVDDVGVVGAYVLELDLQLLADIRELVGEEDVAGGGEAVDEVAALL